MTLVEVLACLGMTVVLAAAGMEMTQNQAKLLKEQQLLEAYTTALPSLRSIMVRTAGQATRTRVFDTEVNARAGTAAGVAVSGGALRMEYTGGPNTPSNTLWQATMEYRASTQQIVYRNQDGAEWVVASKITAAAFAMDGGACRLSITRQGRSADILVAVN